MRILKKIICDQIAMVVGTLKPQRDSLTEEEREDLEELESCAKILQTKKKVINECCLFVLWIEIVGNLFANDFIWHLHI